MCHPIAIGKTNPFTSRKPHECQAPSRYPHAQSHFLHHRGHSRGSGLVAKPLMLLFQNDELPVTAAAILAHTSCISFLSWVSLYDICYSGLAPQP